jgi:hypothetical protein
MMRREKRTPMTPEERQERMRDREANKTEIDYRPKVEAFKAMSDSDLSWMIKEYEITIADLLKQNTGTFVPVLPSNPEKGDVRELVMNRAIKREAFHDQHIDNVRGKIRAYNTLLDLAQQEKRRRGV